MADKSLNQSIIEIRVKLQNANLKKSGKNKFAGFDYFELSDFLPKLNELMMADGVNDRFSIKDGSASLELIKGEESQIYEIPFTQFDTPLNKNGTATMQDIQYLGALNTYYKRYLYLNAFGITDGEVIDSMDNSSFNMINQAPAKKKPAPKAEDQNARMDLITAIKDICAENGIPLTDVFTAAKVGSFDALNADKLKKLYQWVLKKVKERK